MLTREQIFGVTYVTGPAYCPTGFPVVKIDFACNVAGSSLNLQRTVGQLSESHCRGSFVCGVGQYLVLETVS
jgi:hypothetical protein